MESDQSEEQISALEAAEEGKREIGNSEMEMTERGTLRVDGRGGNVCLVTCALASREREKAMTLSGGDTVRCVVAK